jgi:hypothetical protein
MGTEIVLLQWQRAAGLPSVNQKWWTSVDSEVAHLVDALDVEVIEILDEDPDRGP